MLKSHEFRCIWACLAIILLMLDRVRSASIHQHLSHQTSPSNPLAFTFLSMMSTSFGNKWKTPKEIMQMCPQLWAFNATEFQQVNSQGVFGHFDELSHLCQPSEEASSIVCQGAVGISNYVCKVAADTKTNSAHHQLLPPNPLDEKTFEKFSNVTGLCSILGDINFQKKLCNLVSSSLKSSQISCNISTENFHERCISTCSGENNQRSCQIILQSLRTIMLWETMKENAEDGTAESGAAQSNIAEGNSANTDSSPPELIRANDDPTHQATVKPTKKEQNLPLNVNETNIADDRKQIHSTTSEVQTKLSATAKETTTIDNNLSTILTTNSSTTVDKSKNSSNNITSRPLKENPTNNSIEMPSQEVVNPKPIEVTKNDESFTTTEALVTSQNQSPPLQEIPDGLENDPDFGMEETPRLDEPKLLDDNEQNVYDQDLDDADKGMDNSLDGLPSVQNPQPIPKYNQHSSDEEDAINTHFLFYFLVFVALSVCSYIVYQRRSRIIALVVEGRSGSSGRRRGGISRGDRPSSSSYRKLVNNLEEAITSHSVKNSNVIY